MKTNTSITFTHNSPPWTPNPAIQMNINTSLTFTPDDPPWPKRIVEAFNCIRSFCPELYQGHKNPSERSAEQRAYARITNGEFYLTDLATLVAYTATVAERIVQKYPDQKNQPPWMDSLIQNSQHVQVTLRDFVSWVTQAVQAQAPQAPQAPETKASDNRLYDACYSALVSLSADLRLLDWERLPKSERDRLTDLMTKLTSALYEAKTD